MWGEPEDFLEDSKSSPHTALKKVVGWQKDEEGEAGTRKDEAEAKLAREQEKHKEIRWKKGVRIRRMEKQKREIRMSRNKI